MSNHYRIPYEEALDLYLNLPLEKLQTLAQDMRQKKHPGNVVTYVLDANPNYTNVCRIDCKFCAFYRKPHHKDAYLLTIDDYRRKLEKYQNAGIRTVLLQGGVHPNVGIDFLVELVQVTRREFPSIHPHYFSAVEIHNAAKLSNISDSEALKLLWDAGQRTIPGGGAEILSENIRKQISPKKMGPNGWINFHKEAHLIGFKTTATMMFGHIETAQDILIHLETLRSLQDETSGFSSFIPWSYKSENTALGRFVTRKTSFEQFFRLLAFSRIYLDNFPHIASSRLAEGEDCGKLSLDYGADDFGGTILDESVHKCTGWSLESSKEELCSIIRSAGYTPIERDSFYNHIPSEKNLVEI
ncbi:cyclic dehypoxanthinyl futalosine synthase [Chlamydiifrater phoenicopteri]|uniref:cyclic dehypoxanthinyl futalosine synthase n=1 Tax=Chlamydiifrater phoenicopteri TaxID=2681469 RepID=UPI001BD00BF5|nr:cyclic dehypoxanthinyl futalosine synthase [Chlamydiifrater phoenicopteri]